MEYPMEVELLSLSQASEVHLKDDIGFASLSQLETLIDGNDAQRDSDQYHSSTSLVDYSTAVVKKFPQNMYYHTDVFFPSGESIAPSPYGELYPFPVSINPHGQTQISEPAVNQLCLRARAHRLEASLATFRSTLPEHSPSVLQFMEDLANTYYDLGNYALSHQWWKHIVSVRENFRPHESPKVVSAMLQLLCVMRRHAPSLRDLKTLEDEIQARLEENFSLEHDLAFEFLDYKVATLNDMKQFSESEELCRRMLQIALTRLGPKHRNAVASIGLLGQTISRKLKTQSNRQPGVPKRPNAAMAGAVHLSRTAVQLYTEIGSLLDRKGLVLTNRLLAVFRLAGDYEGASHLSEIMSERCRIASGKNHTMTLRYLAELGASYRRLERYEESVAALQQVLELQNPDTSKLDTAWRHEELGTALRGLNRFEEAARHLEIVLAIYWEQFGVLDQGEAHKNKKTIYLNTPFSPGSLQLILACDRY
jgi:tetratricopeptide (TPR) repeat protein